MKTEKWPEGSFSSMNISVYIAAANPDGVQKALYKCWAIYNNLKAHR